MWLETKGESERKRVRENWTLQRLHTYSWEYKVFSSTPQIYHKPLHFCIIYPILISQMKTGMYEIMIWALRLFRPPTSESLEAQTSDKIPLPAAREIDVWTDISLTKQFKAPVWD